MFSLLSNDTANSLRDFLLSILPEISDSWWTAMVLPALSFHQQRSVSEKEITALNGLDLAALLRVLDKNWYEISSKHRLTGEARTWTREMQHIRNKWAHVGDHPEKEDLYRDLDTLQRFLVSINAPQSLIHRVKARKDEVMSHSAFSTSAPGTPHASAAEKTQDTPATGFSLGEMVYLKADESVTGAVISVIPGHPENRYLVFSGNKQTQYYESQLARFMASTLANPEPIDLDKFHASLTALQLQYPGLANLYSLHAARVNYIPYQFKPVLKLVRSDRPRLLIADEVGVGKTIEAGLILRELQSRSNIESVLIICPRPLVTEHKWRNEMKRFDEDFVHLDGPTLRSCIAETDKDGRWPSRYAKAILPFSLFNEELFTGSVANRRKQKGLLELDPLPHYDLVIVDEAHHLRNPATWLHRGVEFFCSNAEAVVFLSATPIQLASDDLFVLLNLLRPDFVIDTAVYQRMSAPNPFINRAIELARGGKADWQFEAAEALQRAAGTDWGRSVLQSNPEFQKAYDLVTDHELNAEERIALIRSAEKLHTFASLINRTRRRDIVAFTKRKPETVEVNFTPEQQKLHDDLLQVQARILEQVHGDKNLKFMMTTIRRQASSCIYGLAPLLKDILTRRLDVLELDEIDPELEGELTCMSTLRDKIKDVLIRAEHLDPLDLKLDALVAVINGKQQLDNNKILLFSSFRHTLAYLLENLALLDLRIGYIHGGTPDEERNMQRARFSLPREDPDALDILLSSEVGCEGLDYQFCDCLVNYDLPWNPMRVEQRIGRIDRYGQRSEAVAIYNLITAGTVDADIYHRCLWRIGVFHAALGGSEEIIGDLTEKIREVAESLSLSDEERQQRLQQLSDNEIRIVQEQTELEEQQSDLFGLRLPSHQSDDEVQKAASFWLTPNALQRMVRLYLQQVCGEGHEYILGEKPQKSLRIGSEGRETLYSHYRRLPKRTTPVYRDWEKWLKGANQHLAVTFDAGCAGEQRNAVFITPVHPLALQAADAVTPKETIFTSFKVEVADLPPGNYPFAIYQWSKSGLREDVCFQPVCESGAVSERFFDLLQAGVSAVDVDDRIDQSVVDALDVQHHGLWSSARLEHVSENIELVRFRLESLKTSHAARTAVLREQLANTANEKIKLMRTSQLDNAQADFSRRVAELEKAARQADITAHPVAYGVMMVE